MSGLVLPEGVRPCAAHALRAAWLMIADPAKALAIETALAAAGWDVTATVHSLGHAHALLGNGAAMPDVIVTGLRFDDGDALQFIRTLARHPVRPALFFASHQQRAVIKAAVAMAATCGVGVAGFAEQPVDPSAIALGLMDFDHEAFAPKQRPPSVPLDKSELFDLFDRGTLHPWMQPKLRISSLEVVGFEALIRAHDAHGRLVTPDRIVGALARHDLLDQATMHMARQTVQFVASCLGEGMAVSASINVSMQSLSNLAFCRELEHTVAHAGLDPSWITLEITETDAMADLSTVIENTARIRMSGFNISIDDFGTAYSSLYQLSCIPFSELKIERAFVMGIEHDAGKQAIVRACAQLGASLGLQVIAEGVETQREFDWVRRLGCSAVQGYLVARPMPVPQAMQWLRALPDLRFTL